MRQASLIWFPFPARDEVLQIIRSPFQLGKRLLPTIRFPFPLGKGLGVRFLGRPSLLAKTISGGTKLPMVAGALRNHYEW
jgi:hypothetical protein